MFSRSRRTGMLDYDNVTILPVFKENSGLVDGSASDWLLLSCVNEYLKLKECILEVIALR